ncbi:hydroxymethylglutaryl-CoA lyase [Prauserella sediminis]|uniref:Hydroxymethylglutaryl-CoA lyase n=1 Tax=Prauserella sediminis TaxID=577680 RepID=A0A839XVS2_9PSEU|nr:hydroxymethylglutaryl-CoA lyase [Prauserella sediminis]MBB3664623.1 hydroxymethylglutaryl-CoA lyase [Prauserella sediminis]
MADVLITETALRDGLQNEPGIVPTATKVQLARLLVEAGFTSLEIGAFVRPDRVPSMADTDELVTALGAVPGVALHALAFNSAGAERAVACGVDSVRLTVSASDGHSQANTGAATARALERLERCAGTLTTAGVRVEAAVATAFVCPFDGDTDPARVSHVVGELLEMGAERIHLADTIGAAHPAQVCRTIATVQDAYPELELGLHLHNTYGMALVNAREAHRAGIRRFDAAVGGIGGCPFAPGAAGNIATDDLVNLFHHDGIDTGIDPAALTEARTQLRTAVGRELDSALAAVPAAPVPRPLRGVGAT